MGHQAYPHKILTGRKEKMNSLRQENGLSGFTNIQEFIFDAFGCWTLIYINFSWSGHGCWKRLKGEKNNIISIIGDGAMSAGMALEALNNLGSQKKKMIVILNDNDMSIAPAVGAVSSYLSKLISSKPLTSIREIAKQGCHLPNEIERESKKSG